MSTSIKRTGHDERTSHQPRRSEFYDVRISAVQQINHEIKTFQLTSDKPIKFLSGQWLDVHIPALPKPGGFTITSTPIEASQETGPYVNLAIKRSPENPPAAWLWRPRDEVINQGLRVRVGGSFTWPPGALSSSPSHRIDEKEVDHVVFVAGGVGINPLISMVETISRLEKVPMVSFLYSTKFDKDELETSKILFLDDLIAIRKRLGKSYDLRLFLTGVPAQHSQGLPEYESRRITKDDLLGVLGDDRARTVCYICGPPVMTDEFVDFLTSLEGLEAKRVLCEKWW